MQVAFWFEKDEGRPSASLEEEWLEELRIASIDDEYEEELPREVLMEEVAKKRDEQRVDAIKALLYDLYRVPTGEDKLSVDYFIQQLASIHGNGKSFVEFLFEI